MARHFHFGFRKRFQDLKKRFWTIQIRVFQRIMNRAASGRGVPAVIALTAGPAGLKKMSV